LEWASFLDKLNRDPPPLWGIAWYADYPDPDSFLRASNVRLYTRWRNETYERLVEEARRVMGQGERMRLYRQADRILVEEAAIIPLTYSREHILVKPWVRNLPISALGGWFWNEVIIEAH
jgi:oligopeptide transport system substrate-binding protein